MSQRQSLGHGRNGRLPKPSLDWRVVPRNRTVPAVLGQSVQRAAASGYPTSRSSALKRRIVGVGRKIVRQKEVNEDLRVVFRLKNRTRTAIFRIVFRNRKGRKRVSNIHRVEVESDSARFSMSIENIPSENPKTGRITALSVIAYLRKQRSPLRVGT